jgi:hypothetical protein
MFLDFGMALRENVISIHEISGGSTILILRGLKLVPIT